MAEGRNRAEWARCSSLLALLANIHRKPGVSPFTPADFDPFARPSAPEEPAHAVALAALKPSLLGLFPERPEPTAELHGAIRPASKGE